MVLTYKAPIYYAAPQPTGLPWQDIRSLAANFAKKTGYTPEKPLVDYVASIGGEIIGALSPNSSKRVPYLPRIGWPDNTEYARGSDVSIRVDGVDEFKIYTGAEAYQSNNYAMPAARMLGHYYLHFLYPRERAAADPSLSAPENLGAYESEYRSSPEAAKEATWFATAFLMNENKFKAKYKEYYGDQILIGSYFHVAPGDAIDFGKMIDKTMFANIEECGGYRRPASVQGKTNAPANG